MGGGAWPFLVGGVICLVNSDNEGDSVLLEELDLKNPGKVESNLVSPCVLRLTCYALQLPTSL